MKSLMNSFILSSQCKHSFMGHDFGVCVPLFVVYDISKILEVTSHGMLDLSKLRHRHIQAPPISYSIKGTRRTRALESVLKVILGGGFDPVAIQSRSRSFTR